MQVLMKHFMIFNFLLSEVSQTLTKSELSAYTRSWTPCKLLMVMLFVLSLCILIRLFALRERHLIEIAPLCPRGPGFEEISLDKSTKLAPKTSLNIFTDNSSLLLSKIAGADNMTSSCSELI